VNGAPGLVSGMAPWPRGRRLRTARPLLRRWLRGLAGLGLLGLAWWVAVTQLELGGMQEHFAPGAVLAAGLELIAGDDLWRHVFTSLGRIGVGLAGALALGAPVGLLVGSSARADELTSPAIQFLRMISPLSWMPLAVMAFGVGDRPIWFLLIAAAVWPIVLSTAAGVRQLPREWLELGKSLAATPLELFYRLIIPGVLPHVLTGVRLAIGTLWIVLVPAEMLGVSAGLGYVILDARDRLAYSELMALVIVVGALGFTLDAAARWLCRRASAGAP
jgi:NitT/TauT family transport system permease protein